MIDILIIDDDKPTRALLVDVLSEGGYRVADAGNGAEGLALTKTLQPRLILTDVHMPDMDGITFARQLRARADLAQPPIIFMTARAGVFPRAEGATLCLSKPFDLDGLLAHMQALLPAPATAMFPRLAGAQPGI
jgi:CheY-like chemotaxis protein